MKQTYVLHFVQEQLSLEVEEGTTVMNALKAANIFLDAPCGGKGTCHKCLVQISSDSALENSESLPDQNQQFPVHRHCKK